MPYSLVLNFVPRSPIYPNFLTGRHLHALFLTLVSSVDGELGNQLHAQKQQKAFTLSPVQVERQSIVKRSDQGDQQGTALSWQHSRPIPAGAACWWRVSLLDEALFGHLASLWLDLNPEQPWHLGAADLVVTSVLGTSQSRQPWAASCSYRELYARASDCHRDLTLAFCTPTAFRQGNYDSALPTRDCVFRSLLNKWQRYSDLPMDAEAIASLFPSYFDIRTELVADSRSKFIGCVGTVTYKILGDVSPEWIRQLNALADFAIYAGVGRKTPMGMGMSLRI
ncbi:MAG: CRISPR-associated endoribonuclease Cas6 [Spirulinaceae cyanobacterium RM2_2_10]|nr:CRISPR-associated endoribonuclease Cas6 [Spirulinaceae cyanobacterium SM2_1_0]NJO19957.1 CRISPR-associated endoribonuclease Cas6 [Spirulinaceae cyanobacterium RM2_2_10]